MDIDLVYLWVDGSDPVWLARKNKFLGIELLIDETNCKGRHTDNDELKYSLRSVEKHLPWIRKIFIVTDNQIPDWLNVSHPKIKIIDHRDILPPEALPCYNSVVLEYFLYRIPDLSEHFLYANDDTFVNADLPPDFFFTDKGLPYVRLLPKPFGLWRYRWKRWRKKKLSTYRETILKAALLIKVRYGKFYSGTPHHNIDAYRKSDYQAVIETVFKDEIAICCRHFKRTPNDIQRAILLYYALATGLGRLKYVKQKESRKIGIHRHNYIKYIKPCHPNLFCLNDGEDATDDDRKRAKTFLKAYFPEKSTIEK